MSLGDISFLGTLGATTEQRVNDFPNALEINPIARPEMNPHFRHTLSHGFAITKVSPFSRTDALNDTGFATRIFSLENQSSKIAVRSAILVSMQREKRDWREGVFSFPLFRYGIWSAITQTRVAKKRDLRLLGS